jgi:hypothetical protein
VEELAVTLVSELTILESSRPKSGRRFEPLQELELHEAAIMAARTLPNAARGLTVVREFNGPIGIPDFTALLGAADSLTARQSAGIEAVRNEIDAGIVSALSPLAARSINAVASRLGWPHSTIERRIRILAKAGGVFETRPGSFVRDERLRPLGRLIAIEAKVDDWHSALRQVRTYRVWADAYVLVMGPLSARVLDRLVPEIHRDRGGLVVDGQWLMKPRIGYVAPARRVQGSEYFAAATTALG